jgi:hypothetical protein
MEKMSTLAIHTKVGLPTYACIKLWSHRHFGSNQLGRVRHWRQRRGWLCAQQIEFDLRVAALA